MGSRRIKARGAGLSDASANCNFPVATTQSGSIHDRSTQHSNSRKSSQRQYARAFLSIPGATFELSLPSAGVQVLLSSIFPWLKKAVTTHARELQVVKQMILGSLHIGFIRAPFLSSRRQFGSSIPLCVCKCRRSINPFSSRRLSFSLSRLIAISRDKVGFLPLPPGASNKECQHTA